MNGYLKQSTASQVRTIGPFIDDGDFITPDDGLTIANTDILIKKNGAASGAKNSGGATADGDNGMYAVTWDATDTATIGELYYSVKVAGACIVFGTYVVLDETAYDFLFASPATLTIAAVGTAGITRASFAADTGLQSIRSNTAQAGGASTITLDASASAVDDFYNETAILLTGGTGAGQVRTIVDYVGATKVATVDTAWATNPDNTTTFAIFPSGASASDIAAAVMTALDTDTFGEPTGVPGATVTLTEKIGRLYMVLRNGLTVTATKKQFLDDGGSAEWEKDLSDDGTTYAESEGNAP